MDNLATVIPNAESALEIGSWMLETEPTNPVRGLKHRVVVPDNVGLGVTLDLDETVIKSCS